MLWRPHIKPPYWKLFWNIRSQYKVPIVLRAVKLPKWSRLSNDIYLLPRKNCPCNLDDSESCSNFHLPVPFHFYFLWICSEFCSVEEWDRSRWKLEQDIYSSWIYRSSKSFFSFRKTLNSLEEIILHDLNYSGSYNQYHYCKRVYPKVTGLTALSENCKWYNSLPLDTDISPFCESV